LSLRTIGALGLHGVRRTRKPELVALLESLHPVDSGIPLVRLGPDGDGGYLVPDDLDGIEYAFSPGVSDESGFEADLAERGIRVFLADHSVDGPAESNPLFSFDKKYVGCLEDERFVTLDGWKQARIPDYAGDLLVQMDIEGAEFEAIMSLSPALQRQIRIIIIEFHYLHQLWNKPWFRLVSRTFEKLLSTHSVVHIHPNNCCGSFSSRGLTLPRIAEFTFLRNDRLKTRRYRSDFPHALDRDNVPGKRPLVLPRCWYRN
jgi:hypothetical protein